MDIIQLVSTLGFPIVAAISVAIALKYLFDEYNKKEMTLFEKNREERMLQEARYDEISKNLQQLCSAVNNNTEAILKLISE